MAKRAHFLRLLLANRAFEDNIQKKIYDSLGFCFVSHILCSDITLVIDKIAAKMKHIKKKLREEEY